MVRAVEDRIATGRRAHHDASERGCRVGRRGAARRFGLPFWQFTLSATDANGTSSASRGHVTGRPKLLVFDYCYHGTVDESFAVARPDGRVMRRPGSRRPAGADPA